VAVTLSRCAGAGGYPSGILVQRIETNDAQSAASVPELTADSDLVVRGVVTGRRSLEVVAGVPFIVSEVRVTETMAGPPASVVWVRQVGGPGVETPRVPALVPGRAYVLFLQRFAYGPESPSDQYVVTGNGAGIQASTPSPLRSSGRTRAGAGGTRS
jgi:hypothetical protein